MLTLFYLFYHILFSFYPVAFLIETVILSIKYMLHKLFGYEGEFDAFTLSRHLIYSALLVFLTVFAIEVIAPMVDVYFRSIFPKTLFDEYESFGLEGKVFFFHFVPLFYLENVWSEIKASYISLLELEEAFSYLLSLSYTAAFHPMATGLYFTTVKPTVAYTPYAKALSSATKGFITSITFFLVLTSVSFALILYFSLPLMAFGLSLMPFYSLRRLGGSIYAIGFSFFFVWPAILSVFAFDYFWHYNATPEEMYIFDNSTKKALLKALPPGFTGSDYEICIGGLVPSLTFYAAKILLPQHQLKALKSFLPSQSQVARCCCPGCVIEKILTPKNTLPLFTQKSRFDLSKGNALPLFSVSGLFREKQMAIFELFNVNPSEANFNAVRDRASKESKKNIEKEVEEAEKALKSAEQEANKMSPEEKELVIPFQTSTFNLEIPTHLLFYIPIAKFLSYLSLVFVVSVFALVAGVRSVGSLTMADTSLVGLTKVI